jgi:hypothetical protein
MFTHHKQALSIDHKTDHPSAFDNNALGQVNLPQIKGEARLSKPNSLATYPWQMTWRNQDWQLTTMYTVTPCHSITLINDPPPQ